MSLPKAFVQRIQQLEKNPEELLDSLDNNAPSSVRLHPVKSQITVPDLPFGGEVPWNEEGRFLSSLPHFHRDPLYHAGVYYPMESSSMFIKEVLNQVDLQEDELILDLCAAPGGKTLIVKDFFPNHLLVSNEIEHKRALVLRENSVRWGTTKHLVVNGDAPRTAQSGMKFGLVLIDAPCSGEGLFRKDRKSREHWTSERAAGCAIRQSKILEEVDDLIADGGTLIYSTCTFNPVENLDQIQSLVAKGYKPIKLEIPEAWNIEKKQDGRALGYQFRPDQNPGEGFFISVLKKEGENNYSLPQKKHTSILPPKELSIPQKFVVQEFSGQLKAFDPLELDAFEVLSPHVKVLKCGTLLGAYKGPDFIPALDCAMQPEQWFDYKTLDLKEGEAKAYLSGEALTIQTDKGVVVMSYKGVPLGFGKSNGKRINNLYPKHLRVRGI